MGERTAIPKPLSKGEEAFALHCRAEKLTPERELLFHPTRKWRFDFAFPENKLAIEIEGLSRGFSAHMTFKGYREDLEKNNAATMLGWRVLRYTTEQVLAGAAINDVLELLK